jgi:hypothetical protein
MVLSALGWYEAGFILKRAIERDRRKEKPPAENSGYQL